MPFVDARGVAYTEDDFTDPWKPKATVVLQHGFCRNGGFWYPWVPWLSRHYRVLRPDLRGCGASLDPGETYRYEIDDLVDDLFAVLGHAGAGAVHYVGEHLGGALGAIAAAREPQRFRSLTLLGMMTSVDAGIQQGLAVGYPSWHEAMEDLGVREWWLRARATSGGLTGDAVQDGWVADQAGRTPTHVALGLSSVARKWDFTEILPQIPVPTLLLSSENRFATSAVQQQELKSLLSRSLQYRYEDVDDHFFMYQTIPDVVAQDALDFFQSVDAGHPVFRRLTI